MGFWGFVAWKPVAYSGETPGFENKALAFNDYWSSDNEKLPNKGSLSLYEGTVPWTLAFNKNTNYFGVNVTFGQNKDGGYLKSGFLQW